LCKVFFASFLLALLIVWKGGSSKITLSNAQSAGVSFGVGGAVAAIVATFFIPFL
jgi:sodium-dependent phosphate transporter